MTELSSKARELLQASRVALRPSDADRARVEAALHARLAAPHPELSIARTSATMGGPAAVAATIVAACVLGTAGFIALRPRPSAPVPKAPATLPAPVSETAPPAAAEPGPVAATPTPPSEPRPATNVRRRDPLAQEVVLLSRATRSLRAGEAAAALALLEQHQRNFPNGALREERLAAKAQALCVLGRTSQGREELARLMPASPSAARARQVCDAAEHGSAQTK